MAQLHTPVLTASEPRQADRVAAGPAGDLAVDGICAGGPRERVLQLGDGRLVRLSEYGATAGVPVIALHGTPGSRLKFRGAHETAVALGIRLIAPDRWGYGGSDAPARPGLAAYGDDLAALADALGIGRFGILAVSGGGPFGAMAASLLGERITGLALVCPVGPMAGNTPAGTSAFHRFCFNALPRIPGAVRLVFGSFSLVLRHAPDAAVRLATVRAAAADRALMAGPPARRQLAETFASGLARCSSGAVIDMTLFSRAWSISDPVQARSRLWIGTEDRNVPLPAARQLAGRLGAEIVEKQGCGHYWIGTQWREILAWLAEPRQIASRD